MNYAKLPIVKYRGTFSFNIMHRIAVTPEYLKAKSNYYPYLIVDGERPDTIAFKEYGDENLDWLVMMPNNIYDIKSQWPLSQNDLDNQIEENYGSLSNASGTISHYTIDYSKQNIDVEAYNNLSGNNKRYWKFNNTSNDFEVINYFPILNPDQYNNIPVDERHMWRSVSVYENEQIKNEEKRSILLISKTYISSIKLAASKIFKDVVDDTI